jgi:hypothetical protein
VNRNFFIEVNSQQRNHNGERICGDVFLYRYIKEEDRVIAVLSDRMGHGVKANILATLTATMAVSLTREHKKGNFRIYLTCILIPHFLENSTVFLKRYG